MTNEKANNPFTIIFNYLENEANFIFENFHPLR